MQSKLHQQEQHSGSFAYDLRVICMGHEHWTLLDVDPPTFPVASPCQSPGSTGEKFVQRFLLATPRADQEVLDSVFQVERARPGSLDHQKCES